MGKLIRNGIEYGGGNGTDIFKVTQAEYDALEQAGTLVHNALYVITDAPNLNATASDIEYSSGVTVKQAIDSKVGSDYIAIQAFEINNLSVSNNTDYNYPIDITKTGYTPIGVIQSGFVGNYGTRFHFAKQFIVGNQLNLTFRANAESFSTTGFAVNVTVLYVKA